MGQPRPLPPLATLAALEIPLTAAEAALVLGPLLLFFPALSGHAGLLVWPLVALLVWSAAFYGWLRPLTDRRGREPPETVYRRALNLPGYALRLRLVLWGLVGLGGGLELATRGAIAREQIFTVLTVALVHSLAAGLVRWALQGWLLRRELERRRLFPCWLAMQADTLFDRLTAVSLVLGACSASFLLLFVVLFMPISLEQYLRIETYFPWTGVILGGIWYFVALPRQVQPLLDHLQQPRSGEEETRAVLAQACSRGHRLPFLMASSKLAFFAIGALLLLVQAVTLYDIAFRQAILMFATVVLVSAGASIYEMIWVRSVLRPVLSHLLSRPGAEQLQVRALSLRRKMLLSFGGVVVFCVAIALLWTYLQHDRLRVHFAGLQASRELEALLEAVRARPADPLAALRERRPLPGSSHVFIPASGPGGQQLPGAAEATIRRCAAGALELTDHGLVGAYGRIDPRRPELGSVAVLLQLEPGGGAPEQIAGPVFFFAVVLAISLGVVALTAADLIRPIAALERRASEMAGGQIDQEVVPGGEYDTSGRLSSAFEQIRRNLQDKIRTIEALNVGLEEKVRQRTGELERSNAELVQAINALKEAQQRLVLSEKMASVGQLVAGIAHEINNPINAVVNSVEPLAAELEELLKLTAEPAGEHAGRVLEAQQDVAEMLRVIRSGAQRAQRIVLALRNYARRDAEEPVPILLQAEVEETLALLQHNLRDVEIERDMEETGEIFTFRGQLNQILMNLLSNAASAVEGRRGARIAIRTRGDADQVRIEIEDNGPGIPASLLPRIFDPFFTTKDVGKGTGLGLSITHGIVERHGGVIAVASSESGTSFTVTLPRSGPSATRVSGTLEGPV